LISIWRKTKLLKFYKIKTKLRQNKSTGTKLRVKK